MPPSTAALHSPAAERNKGPLLDALLALLPAEGSALEIASGSGQHLAHFAAGMPAWHWQGSDPTDEALASIAAWVPAGPAPLRLDVQQADWGLGAQRFDAVFCANMLHISPWASCRALMQGAARHLTPTGRLIVYGPFIVPGQLTAPSNLAFDADLRRRDPAWGVRALDAVEIEAAAAGLHLRVTRAMPANNLLLVFTRKLSDKESP